MRLSEPSQTFVSALVSGQYDSEREESFRREIYVFNRCIERVLGVSENSFDLIKAEELTAWLSLLDKTS
jgi:hypothetical protein